MKSAFFARMALGLAAVGLGACQQEKPPAPDTSDTIKTLRFARARLVLPAVNGNPGAIYFEVTNMAPPEVDIISVNVDGAQSATMHETEGGTMNDLFVLPIKPGETVKFEPGGRHIMAMGLADTLKPGGKTHVTLHSNRAQDAVIAVDIVAPGDAR